ncbi:hypothetical protein AB1K83_16830 [Sporosarcina sp. 179-K 3D1 HS]|uniref:hypothetical protein n=1 Tax=Sporosarcina sp. 179-K 3D1 HS TaxID=3232169 RepID=UPI0039A3F37D
MKYYLQSLNGTICVLNEERSMYAHPHFCDVLIDHSKRMDDEEFAEALKNIKLHWLPVPWEARFPHKPMAIFEDGC